MCMPSKNIFHMHKRQRVKVKTDQHVYSTKHNEGRTFAYRPNSEGKQKRGFVYQSDQNY